MALIQKLGFEGHLDKDSDPTKVAPGNYTDALNVQFLTNNTESTKSHIPMKGNIQAFVLGATSVQNKTWRITSPLDATNDLGGIFLYDQNGNLFPTIGGQAQPMTWNRNQAIANQATDILAMFATIDGPGNTSVTTSGDYIFIQCDTISGYDIGLNATTTTGAGPTVSDTSLDPEIYQEAYDLSLTGENHAIGSFDLLGDLYVWSTAQTHLPTVITPTITNIVRTAASTTPPAFEYVVTTNAAHGLTTGWKVAIKDVVYTTGANTIDPNGLWIVRVINATSFALKEWYNIDPGNHFVYGSGGTITIYTEGVGIIGVGQFDANTDAWTYTRIAQTKQWNFTTKKQIDTYCEQNSVQNSVYWTDDYNVPRVIYYVKEYNANGVLLPFVTDGIIETINPTGLYIYETINLESKLQLTTSGATLTFLQQLQTGGQVPPGNWRYAIEFLTSSLTTTAPSDLTNPINVYAAQSNGDPKLIIGNAPGDATPKINQLKVTNILPGLFKYVQLIGVNYSGDAVVGYIIRRELLSDTQTSIVLNHTGTENGTSNYDLALLNQQYADIATAKNIDVIDKRMILSNITTQQKADFTDWAASLTHGLYKKDLAAVRSAVHGTIRVGEYQLPENVNNYLGYMHNETYRFGVKLKMKTGAWTQAFWVDDIIINCDATVPRRFLALTDFDLTTGGAVGTCYSTYVKFAIGDAALNYLIDGVRLKDLIDEISFVRAEVVPTILVCGMCVPSIQHVQIFDDPHIFLASYGDDGTGSLLQMGEFPLFSGRTASGTVSANPLYTSGTFFERDRSVAAFYSPDIQFNHISIVFESGDKINNFGNPFFYAFNNGYTSGPIPSNYAEYSGRTDRNAFGVINLGQSAFVKSGTSFTFTSGKIYTKAFAILDPILHTYTVGNIRPSLVLEDNGTGDVFEAFAGQEDRAFYYSQYYRALTDQYGNKNLTQYVSTGHSLKVTSISGVSSEEVFGGDTFTQLNYFHHRFISTFGIVYPQPITGYTPADVGTATTGFGGGVAFYCQNRINAQMKQKSVSQTGNLYPGIATIDWLEEASNTNGTDGEAYQEGYTEKNEVQSIVAFDPNLQNTNDFPARIIWSAVKPQGSPSDQYRNFLPLNFHDLDQTFGEIVHHANSNGELVTWQQRAFMRQYFNTRGTLDVSGITEVLIGDGSVMSRDGVTVSRLGCKHKWAIIKGKSAGGNDTFYWINTEIKKALRFGYDGTVSIADVKGMQSFIANNVTWVNQYDTPADGQGISGFWDDRYANAGWTMRARRTTPYTYDATTNWTNIGRLVFYQPAVYSTFEKTGELFLLKFSNGPATVVVTPVAVYPLPLVVSILTGTTVLTITTASAHKLVTGDQVMFTGLVGLSTDINRVFHAVTVTGATTFTITVSALINYYIASSGSITEVNAKYWEFIEHTNSDYYNEYTLLFNEFKNAFTTFASFLPKIYLKWTDTFLSPRPISPEDYVYQHDKGNYLSWYSIGGGDVQTERAHIEGVVNAIDDEVKWYKAIAVESAIVPKRIEFTNTNQKSYLDQAEFKTRLRNHFAPVKKDSTNTGINNGNTSAVYDNFLKVKTFFEVNVYQALKSITVKFTISPRLKNR